MSKGEEAMTYTKTKELIQELGREELQELLDNRGTDVIEAALDCGISPETIEEAYCGEWKDDEEFTQDLLEQLGTIPDDFPAYIHIDWEYTARDIMMDYHEENGHYFRVL